MKVGIFTILLLMNLISVAVNAYSYTEARESVRLMNHAKEIYMANCGRDI